ncbi:hypothetical protein FA09DRAFT_347181, partial [Tilletiopsis washingtonensis]
MSPEFRAFLALGSRTPAYSGVFGRGPGRSPGRSVVVVHCAADLGNGVEHVLRNRGGRHGDGGRAEGTSVGVRRMAPLTWRSACLRSLGRQPPMASSPSSFSPAQACRRSLSLSPPTHLSRPSSSRCHPSIRPSLRLGRTPAYSANFEITDTGARFRHDPTKFNFDEVLLRDPALYEAAFESFMQANPAWRAAISKARGPLSNEAIEELIAEGCSSNNGCIYIVKAEKVDETSQAHCVERRFYVGMTRNTELREEVHLTVSSCRYVNAAAAEGFDISFHPVISAADAASLGEWEERARLYYPAIADEPVKLREWAQRAELYFSEHVANILTGATLAPRGMNRRCVDNNSGRMSFGPAEERLVVVVYTCAWYLLRATGIETYAPIKAHFPLLHNDFIRSIARRTRYRGYTLKYASPDDA